MSELSIDPMINYYDTYEGTVATEPYLSSIPLGDRQVHHETWRRIVEQPDSMEEFSICLSALSFLRSSGILTPPYSATIETYEDGYRQYILQVGHVENGQHFDKVDFTDEQVLTDYQELGNNILNYFEFCQNTSHPFLTDIAKVDQFLYGKNASMDQPKPILVDLELHTSDTNVMDQLEMFRSCFIGPLEQKCQAPLEDLRVSVTRLLSSISTI